MGSSLIQPLTLNGVSTYSSDFQSILNRAVQLAQLPARVLQNQQTNLQQEIGLASNLNSAVANLTSAVTALGQLGATKALTASSTDSNVVTATVTGATSTASHTISNVTSISHAAAESSLNHYSDSTTQPVSATGSMRLTVGANQYDITLGPGQNSLSGLQTAINAKNAGVTATILTTSGGNYLAVSANQPGATTLALSDDPAGSNSTFLTATNQGANTVFQFDGVPVSEPGTLVNDVVPGLTLSFNAVGAANQTIGINLSSSGSQLSSALQNLAGAYNAVANQVGNQTGTNAGLLSGNSILVEVRQALMGLVNYYGGSGSVHNISNLGMSLDKSGQMSFDPNQLSALSNSQLNDALEFLGSATTGLGALQSTFSQISDPATGLIHAQLTSFNAQNQRLTDQINGINDRVNIMQAYLQSRLQAADAAIAALQSQQSILTASIQSLNYSTYGQQAGSSR